MAQVDVLISAYNAGATIDAAMASIVNQTFSDFRIVIVDDGSTDDTAKRLSDWAARDPRILPLFLAKNRGIVDAVNRRLQHCEAEFVARFDADDIAFPDRLKAQPRLSARIPSTRLSERASNISTRTARR